MRRVIHDEPAQHRVWEDYADEVPLEYARADGLERFLAREDERLDREEAATIARVGRINRMLDHKKGDLLRWWRGAEGDVERGLYEALAIVLWDTARALADQRDMMVGSRPKRGECPFPSLAAALAADPRPTRGLGGGLPQPVIAETRKEYLAAAATLRRRGRRRPLIDSNGTMVEAPGWLPFQTMYLHTFQVRGSSNVRGLHGLELALDIEAASFAAGTRGTWEHQAVFELLVGRSHPTPLKLRGGTKESKRLSQYQETPVPITLLALERAAIECSIECKLEITSEMKWIALDGLGEFFDTERLDRGRRIEFNLARHEAKKAIQRAHTARREAYARHGLIPAPPCKCGHKIHEHPRDACSECKCVAYRAPEQRVVRRKRERERAEPFASWA